MSPDKTLRNGRQKGTLALYFAAQKEGKQLDGILYFLIEQGYTKRPVHGAERTPVGNGYHNYEGSLDDFIDTSLNEKDCIGLVPLNETMRAKLKNYGLTVFLSAEQDEFVYEMYHRENKLKIPQSD